MHTCRVDLRPLWARTLEVTDDEGGHFWLAVGDLCVPVNFCPLCGAKAPAQVAMPEAIVSTDLAHHPLWDRIKAYIHIQVYARDGGHADPRVRIEMDDPGPQLRAQALTLRVACCACGEPIHPIRQRAPSKRSDGPSLYIAVACPLEANVACSRGPEAREAYLALRRALGDTPPVYTQRVLF